MNHPKLLFLATVSSLLLPLPAFANTDSTNIRFQNIKQVRPETKDTRKEVKETIGQNRDEFRKQRITAVQNGLYNSFTVRFNVLKSYQDRVQKHLDEKKIRLPNNQNLIDAQTKLNTLPGLYDTFNKDLASYKATIDSISTSTSPMTLLSTLKTQAKTVETDIKNVRQALVAALRLIVSAK